MTYASLESNGLFQLNVLVWATLPSPDGAPVIPILHRRGYRLFSLEQPLAANVQERARLEGREPPVSAAPVADALLRQDASSHFVVIELKASSFGPASDQARQARGFVVAGGDITQRGLPIAEGKAEVWYIVPGGETEVMEETLMALQVELQADGLQTCDVGAVGVTIRADGVYLGAERDAQADGRLPPLVAPPERVVRTSVGDDPRPLYVIPWMPESENEDLSALREKLRSQVLSHIGRCSVGEVTLRFSELLDEVSRGLYSLWRDRPSLRGQVNTTVGGLLRALTGSGPDVVVRADELTVRWGSEEKRESVMEHIRLAETPPKPPQGLQLSLDSPGSDADRK